MFCHHSCVATPGAGAREDYMEVRMTDVGQQLELLGLRETVRRAELGAATINERKRAISRVMAAHEIKSSVPEMEDLSFLHSGLAQTCLPHNRMPDDSTPWRRTSGKFSLIISPGVVNDDEAISGTRYVGVPYGTRARLILIYLQTEGVKSRMVSLGPNLSSFLRSLGLGITGGRHGSITAVREQCLRIARCQFTMQWASSDETGRRAIIQDTKIVDGLELWTSRSGREWSGAVELTERFQEHLREHAVPLDKRALARLSHNSLGLDLYTLFAYRLPRLTKSVHLRWVQLQSQIGTDYSRHRSLLDKVRRVMPDVLSVYPDARVEVTSSGITMSQSPPAVPRTSVRGVNLIEG